jgi:hypothetical protein
LQLTIAANAFLLQVVINCGLTGWLIKHTKTHYTELKEDKHFNTWNLGFVATALMIRTFFVLVENYIPKTAVDSALFKEMQIFMHTVFEEKLKTDNIIC